jgi:hypothetical protein
MLVWTRGDLDLELVTTGWKALTVLTVSKRATERIREVACIILIADVDLCTRLHIDISPSSLSFGFGNSESRLHGESRHKLSIAS